MGNKQFVIGDSLVVKAGVTERVTGRVLDGWQGRLVALSKHGDIVTILWDSLTLKNITPADIARCEEQGVSWSAWQLVAQDVVAATARDREEDVTATIAALEAQYSWLSLGEQGRRIRQIVNRAQDRHWFASFRAWQSYLGKHLEVPFAARVVHSEGGPVAQGETVTVTRISVLDETYGTIVRVRLKRRIFHLPLHDLRTTDATAQTQQLVEDYAVWWTYRSFISAHLPRPWQPE